MSQHPVDGYDPAGDPPAGGPGDHAASAGAAAFGDPSAHPPGAAFGDPSAHPPGAGVDTAAPSMLAAPLTLAAPPPSTLDVPAPPPGPGVAPPFAAPPTDRSKRGLWIGLGVGGLVLLLCCVGGIGGVAVLFIGGSEQLKRQATEVVTTHLNALRAGDFQTAHDQFCPDLAEQLSREELAAQTRREPFTGFRLDEPNLGGYVEVTAYLRTGAGETERSYLLDAGGQRLRICDIQ